MITVTQMRDEISRVMEGGREAVKSRVRRIIPLQGNTT